MSLSPRYKTAPLTLAACPELVVSSARGRVQAHAAPNLASRSQRYRDKGHSDDHVNEWHSRQIDTRRKKPNGR